MRWWGCVLLLMLGQVGFAQDWRADVLTALGDGGLYVEDAAGHPLLTHRVDEYFVPASTIKLATTACALHRLGKDFRFTTDFYRTDGGVLVVKGYGDPLLLSEEFALIARQLKARGLRTVNGIRLDTSYFAPEIVVDGVENSARPYDALNGALIANFNTIHVRKGRRGVAFSAEPQTPLTPLAIEMAKRLPPGVHRINLAANPAKSLRYFGELLAAFLTKEGMTVNGVIERGMAAPGDRLVYRHMDSQPLLEVIRGVLEFSTNFSANQLFLAMGAQQFGAPATIEKGIRVLTQFLREEVGWNDFQIFEGSGLSRNTRVTPREMMQLLRYWEPHRDLLPLRDTVFMAKTGTLKGVNTYAGYFPLPEGQHHARFVIMVNDQVPFAHKFRIARMLYAGLNGQPPPFTK